MEAERVRAAGDLGAVAPPVPIGVLVERAGTEDVGFLVVTQPVAILIPGCSSGATAGHEWVRAVDVDFVPIEKSIEVGVRIERAGAVGVDLVAIGDTVKVSVRVLHVGTVEVVLLAIGETVTVVVAGATAGGRCRQGRDRNGSQQQRAESADDDRAPYETEPRTEHPCIHCHSSVVFAYRVVLGCGGPIWLPHLREVAASRRDLYEFPRDRREHRRLDRRLLSVAEHLPSGPP